MTDIKLPVAGDGAIVEGIVFKLPNRFMPDQELFETSNRVLFQRLRVNSSKWTLIGLVSAALILAAMSIHNFLAVNNPLGEGILVVEGWIPVPALAESLKAFNSGYYRYVVVVGGPIPGGDGNSDHLTTYDDLAAKRLGKLGFEMKKLVMLNVPTASAGDRTIARATAVKRWLSDSKIFVCCVDVFTTGVHARKSLILFRHALGDRYRVGVRAASNVSYDPRRWFFSARGIWLVARNLAGCVYAEFWILFHGQGSTYFIPTGYIINVNNFGATGNGTTDDTAAINSAIAALQPGYQLFFPCGTYLISSGLNAIVIDNVTVYGQTGCSAGPVTLLSTGNGSTLLQVGNGPWLSGSTPITATTADMDTTFQANFSAIGAGVGDYVYLEETVSNTDTNHTNCGGSGCRGEVLKITGLSGNTATVETALHHAYDTSCCVPWVQKLTNPVSGVAVHDLVLDGSGVANYGLTVLDAVDTTVTNLTAQHVAWSGVAGWNGYHNTYKTITTTHAGMIYGGTVGGAAVTLTQQGNLNVDSVSVNNMNAPAFGFNVIREANGTFSNVSIDATGTGSGRPLKLNSAAHNTLNNVSVNRSEGAYYQGITIEYFSHHNVWNSCKVTNNINYNNSGIALYGDQANGNHQGSNHYNTFNNCNVTGNAGYAVWVLDNNNNIEINGGTYSGLAGSYVLAFGDSGPCCNNNVYIHNATINGPGSTGILIANGSANACINSNTFGPGLTAAINVTASSDIGSGNVLNGLSSNLNPGTCGTPSVSVSVSPSAAMVASGGTQQFTATVTGNSNAAVIWTSSAGSISSSGLFTAPTVSANTNVTVTATSQADTTKTASASVTVIPANTFGYAVQGASVGTTMSNTITAARYQMVGQNGTVTSISVFIASPISASPNNQFQVAIYADNNGTPGALLASSVSQTITPDAWNTVSISAPVTANAYYWLAYNTNGLAANVNNLRYDPVGATSAWISPGPFGTWPTTYGPIAGTSNNALSAYATYQ